MDLRQTGVDIEAKLLWSEGISSKIWRNYDSVITTIWLPYEIKPSFPVNHGYKYGLTQCQDRPVKIFKGTEFDSSLFGLVRGPGKYELISNLIPEITKKRFVDFLGQNFGILSPNLKIRKFYKAWVPPNFFSRHFWTSSRKKHCVQLFDFSW